MVSQERGEQVLLTTRLGQQTKLWMSSAVRQLLYREWSDDNLCQDPQISQSEERTQPETSSVHFPTDAA